jgi:hypothetical protein
MLVLLVADRMYRPSSSTTLQSTRSVQHAVRTCFINVHNKVVFAQLAEREDMWEKSPRMRASTLVRPKTPVKGESVEYEVESMLRFDPNPRLLNIYSRLATETTRKASKLRSRLIATRGSDKNDTAGSVVRRGQISGFGRLPRPIIRAPCR